MYLLTFRGKTQCLSHWANEFNIPRRTVLSRIQKGMNPIQALLQGRTHGNVVHGHAASNDQTKARSREYSAWVDMRIRCDKRYKDRRGYHNYAGRGIRVHGPWKKSFQAFLKHIGPAPSSKHELDRKDTNGHYVPGNVHWVTHQENCQNRRLRG